MVVHYGVGLIKKHKLEDHLLEKILEINRKAESLRRPCRFLDQFYLPTRYGAPTEVEYSAKMAKKAIMCSKKILEFVEKEFKLQIP